MNSGSAIRFPGSSGNKGLYRPVSASALDNIGNLGNDTVKRLVDGVPVTSITLDTVNGVVDDEDEIDKVKPVIPPSKRWRMAQGDTDPTEHLPEDESESGVGMIRTIPAAVEEMVPIATAVRGNQGSSSGGGEKPDSGEYGRRHGGRKR